MVENRRALTLLSHIGLFLGVIFVLFPILIAFLASTQSSADIKAAPMSLWPGHFMWHNYHAALVEGAVRQVWRAAGNIFLRKKVDQYFQWLLCLLPVRVIR